MKSFVNEQEEFIMSKSDKKKWKGAILCKKLQSTKNDEAAEHKSGGDMMVFCSASASDTLYL